MKLLRPFQHTRANHRYNPSLCKALTLGLLATRRENGILETMTDSVPTSSASANTPKRLSDLGHHSCSRRLFLLGTGTTIAGALLAACGNEAPTAEVSEADVPVGSAVIVGDFIVAQPKEGRFVAYSAACPHQRSKITKVQGDTVMCTAHGSVFRIDDGSVVSGPSRDPLYPASLSESDGTLNVSG